MTSPFVPERYKGFPRIDVPLDQIDEPLPHKYCDKTVKRYMKMLEKGEAPPIELIELVTKNGRELKQPYDIYNGRHRFMAALWAGKSTIALSFVM